MNIERNLVKGFERGNILQDIYEALPDSTKSNISQRTRIDRSGLIRSTGVVALACLLSDNIKDRELGAQLLGFDLSLILRKGM